VNNKNGNEELTGTTSINTDPGNGTVEATHGSVQITDDSLRGKELFGRYQIVSLIGTGGMGKVYKTYDPMLKRYAALKVLRGDEPEQVERFLREARSQAQVEHENICKVYEAGIIEGKPFIAMQFIEGKSLLDVYKEMTIEQKVRVIVEVSEALQAAHRIGLIHRDIKPANIMVERSEDSHWKPYVVDFGIAREQSSDGITATGMLVGSIYYMSPEQARGDNLGMDRRTDIYSLGTTLYYVLCEHMPFHGNTTSDTLLKIIHEEPAGLRKVNPHIPIDLETIVMKCLQKEPQLRYESARALAEDLRRYLDGEPIQARPTSVAYRMLKKAKKHKAIFFTVFAALIIVCCALFYGLYTTWMANQQAEFTQQMGQKIEKMEAIMDRAFLLPLHDSRREKNQARAIHLELQALQQKTRSAKAQSTYALGRAFLILDQPEQAELYLKRAWDMKYQQPDVAYALGRVLGILYQREKREAERIGNKEQREKRLAEIETIYLTPGLNFLKKSFGTTAGSPAYLEALIHFYTNQYEWALMNAQRILKDNPDAYEAKRLEGDIYLELARLKGKKGSIQEAQNLLIKAREAYSASAVIARSDYASYEGLCSLDTTVIRLVSRDTGGSITASYEEGLQACQNALISNPESVNAFLLLSTLYQSKADYDKMHGQDPRPLLQKSIETAQKTLNLPRTYRYHIVLRNLGRAYIRIAEYELEHGQDPRANFQNAIMYYQKSLEENPNSSDTHFSIGLIYIHKTEFESERGFDPRSSMNKGIEAFQKAVALDPYFSEAYNSMGNLYSYKSDYEAEHGLDLVKSLNISIGCYKKAICINPSNAVVYTNMSASYWRMGYYLMGKEKDPMPSFKQAVETGNKAIALNPDDSLPYQNSALTYYSIAGYELDKGLVPEKSLQKSRELHLKSIELNPNDFWIHASMGSLETLTARWLIKHHTDPTPAFNNAEKAFKKSLELNSSYAATYTGLAELNWRKAKWKFDKGLSSLLEVKQGIAMANKALAVDPESPAEALALKGVLLLLQAEQESNNSRKQPLITEAQSCLKKALSYNVDLINKEFRKYL